MENYIKTKKKVHHSKNYEKEKWNVCGGMAKQTEQMV